MKKSAVEYQKYISFPLSEPKYFTQFAMRYPVQDFELVKTMNGFTPSGWTFDKNDWWLEENGLIMEKPDFPIPDGNYIVTGGRETQSILR